MKKSDRAFEVAEILSKHGMLSGEQIARRLGISRTAVWKHITKLKKLGFKIEASKRGYMLVQEPDLILPYKIKEKLTTEFMGRRIEHFIRCESSNEIAKALAREGLREGTLVICEEQSRGRGRLSREWISPRGGIWCSLLLKPTLTPGEAPLLGFASALSIAKSIRKLYSLDAQLKWPNDVMIGEKKVAGVLVEVEAEVDAINFAVVGFGIDANFSSSQFPLEVREIATTLRDELGHDIKREELLAEVLNEMEAHYGSLLRGAKSELIAEYKSLCSTLGKKVRVVQRDREIVGKALDIDADGSLIVLTPSRRVKVTYGDCEHLRTA